MRHDTRRNRRLQATSPARPARLMRRSGGVVLAALLLALAGCGGGNDDNNGTANAGNGNAGGAQTDSFFTQVSSIIGTSSETGDPAPTDSITATTPEQTEPSPLG